MQRRYPRYSADIGLRASVLIEDEFVSTVRGHCRELSRGGLGATLGIQLRVGETIVIEIARHTKAYAKVRFVKGFYHGLEFTLLHSSAKAFIDKLCNRYSDEQSPSIALGAPAITGWRDPIP